MARGMLSRFDARARRGRRGITLLEVLISMGILAVGLLSIAALIPAGRLEIMQAVKLDYASMVGRGAFRDLQIRGYLNPTMWQYGTPAQNAYTPGPPNSFNIRLAATGSMAPAAVIDPLGYFANNPYGPRFPYMPNSPLPGPTTPFLHAHLCRPRIERRTGGPDLPLRRRFDANADAARPGFSAVPAHISGWPTADHRSRPRTDQQQRQRSVLLKEIIRGSRQ